MKPEIHPKYQQVDVHCACGETFKTGSTKKELRVEICSKCHPFFTGLQKLVDSAGRIDRFQQRFRKILPQGNADASGPPGRTKIVRRISYGRLRRR